MTPDAFRTLYNEMLMPVLTGAQQKNNIVDDNKQKIKARKIYFNS